MASPMQSTDLALLHHLQTAAAAGGQLPKHVAHALEQQGLVEVGEHSPGEVRLTAAGSERLQALSGQRASSDRVDP